MDAIWDFKQLNPNREIHIKASPLSWGEPSSIHISSTSTSPSPTVNWNFNTQEARDAWALADYHASKAATNEESAMAETECETLAQSMVDTLNEQAAHQRDLEEGRRLFPTPAPGHLSEDSSGRPPLLEEGGGGLAPGPASPSTFMVAMSRNVTSSIDNTPYPTIISLGSEYGGSEYDTADIQCGKCSSPIEYCHCKVLVMRPHPIPGSSNSEQDVSMLAATVVEGLAKGKQPQQGPVVHNLTQDDEETAISVDTTKEDEDTLVWVEVCDGRRMGSETDNRGQVQGSSRLHDPSRTTVPGASYPIPHSQRLQLQHRT